MLWERGHINTNELEKYVMKPCCNDDDEIHRYCLPRILDNCEDFQNEISQLEYIVSCFGYVVITTPKYHAELAGEGIEYAWGVSKSVYRKAPWEQRKGKAAFMQLVKDALCTHRVLTLINVRKFSKKARCYMKVYDAIGKKDHDHNNRNYSDNLDYVTIEKMVKTIKTHRNKSDIMSAYCNDSKWVSTKKTMC